MAQRYWLFKSEPGAYSYGDLERDKVAEWDGVRNYQARNSLRDDIKKGDKVLFYHSNVKPQVIVGIAEVVKEGYPDFTAWGPNSEHPDPKSTPDNPIWYMVDIKPVKRLKREVTLDEIKDNPRLSNLVLVNRSRLSIQPVTKEEFETIVQMGEEE